MVLVSGGRCLAMNGGRARLLTFLGSIVILTGCQLVTETTGTVQELPLATAAMSDMTELTAAQTVLVAQAIDALAADLGVAADTVSLVSVETTTWPDASLGCPEPDMAYAQVLTPGNRIVLAADGVQYEYHTAEDADGAVVTCSTE